MDFSSAFISMVTSVGSAFGVIIGVIIGFLAALIALGMGIRYFAWKVINHTSIGRAMIHVPGVSALDRWSFRHSKEFKRMTQD